MEPIRSSTWLGIAGSATAEQSAELKRVVFLIRLRDRLAVHVPTPSDSPTEK